MKFTSMVLRSLALELTGCSPSTSGRVTLAELLRQRGPVPIELIIRSYSSVVGTGVPSPRHDVALELSTPNGGHLARMINTTESLVELDGMLYKYRKRLRPTHVGAASVKLEHLYRYEQASPYGHRVRRMASELEKYVDTFRDRLALGQVANVVRGLSAVGHRLPPDLLVGLAAGVVADGGTALRLAPDVDVRDLAYGFSGQGYTNPLFWSRLSASALPRLPAYNPNTLPALVLALHAAHQLPHSPSASTAPADPAPSGGPHWGGAGPVGAAPAGGSASAALASEVLRRLCASLERLQPARLADAAQALAVVGPQLGVRPDGELLGRLEASASASFPSLVTRPAQLASLLLALQQLQPPSPLPSPDPRPRLPPQLLAVALPHLRAAIPSMQLLHIKRVVQALGPSLQSTSTLLPEPSSNSTSPLSSSAGATGTDADPLPAVVNLLARRAAILLPAGAARTPDGGPAPHGPSRGDLSYLPRGGKGVGIVLAALARSVPSAVVDEPLVGLMEGLTRAYTAALVPAGAEEGAAGAAWWARVRAERYPHVEDLFARVAALALAGGEVGVLREEQRASLVRCLPLLGAGEHVSGLLAAPAAAAGAAAVQQQQQVLQ